MEIQEFVSGRPKQHVILGGDFNASLDSLGQLLVSLLTDLPVSS